VNAIVSCQYPPMSDGGAGAGAADLMGKLEAAGGDTSAVVALLWTWLEAHLLDFGSLLEKPPTLLAEALLLPPFAGVTAADLEAIAEAPLRAAAILLARIGLAYTGPPVATFDPAKGFDGEDVYVCWRRSELVGRLGRYEGPPSAQEHPSVSTLCPSLVVCPAEVEGIALGFPRVEGREWDVVCQRLEQGLSEGERSTVCFHLDSLGEQGFSRWSADPALKIGALREEEVEPAEAEAARAATVAAVASAAGAANVLVMPELAATEPVLGAIGTELAALGPEAPALTVIGRYHRPAASEGEEADPELAKYVNEAVVLGPRGTELWSHRKLSSAGGEVDTADGPLHLLEDIRLGRTLSVLGTPLGNLSVVTCLDTFAAHSRRRIAEGPANVLLVPSLSEKVNRHHDSLQQLVQGIWGVAFVCNRSPRPGAKGSNWDEDDNRSFCVLQRHKQRQLIRVEGREAYMFDVGAEEKR
jgi:hypothetical protein